MLYFIIIVSEIVFGSPFESMLEAILCIKRRNPLREPEGREKSIQSLNNGQPCVI